MIWLRFEILYYLNLKYIGIVDAGCENIAKDDKDFGVKQLEQ